MSTDQALIRIEYKLDIIMRAMQDYGLMISDLPDLKGIEGDTCPLCRSHIWLSVNLNSEQIERFCGCSLTKRVVPGISNLMKPPEEAPNGSRARKASSEVPSDEAEGDGGGS